MIPGGGALNELRRGGSLAAALCVDVIDIVLVLDERGYYLLHEPASSRRCASVFLRRHLRLVVGGGISVGGGSSSSSRRSSALARTYHDNAMRRTDLGDGGYPACAKEYRTH